MEKEERRSLGVERVNGREMIKKSERANGVKEQRKERGRKRENDGVARRKNGVASEKNGVAREKK